MRVRWTPASLIYALFIFAFACTVALMVYTHRFSGQLRTSGPDVIHPDASPNDYIATTVTTTTTIDLSEQEYMINRTFLPLIDFKDLGRNKTKVLLLIIVSTAPQRFERRQAIRDTWWKHCNGSQLVKCIFMTDGFIVDHIQRNLTIQERNKYKDVELQPLLGGREFGLRFLNQIKWAMAKFEFRYLLRIDDDYFLCLKRLLSELPTRPKKNLVWGHFHCEVGISWLDEAFMVFSKDVIHKFLSQNESTMLCHPHADQQIGLWLNNISKKIFFHDTRLHDSPPASFSHTFDKITNVCDSYLGVHGAYVEKMRYLGLNANDSTKDILPIPKFSSFCQNKRFDYRVFNPEWRYEPKLCKDNPTWNVERKMYVGRENQ